MTEEQMKKRLYGLYQLDWMMSHGYSLADLMCGMNSEGVEHDDHISDTEQDGMHADIERIFSEWEGDVGFPGGCLYVCFDEFCGAELTMPDYIQGLLNAAHDDELEKAYNKWLEKSKMTEEQMKKRLYELYQLDWMMTHGYSLHDVIKGIDDHETVKHDNYIHDGEVGMYADIEGIFNKWQDYVGFSGYCIYSSFHGFCHDELTDSNYIKGLLDRVPSEEGLREAYDKWYKENEGE